MPTNIARNWFVTGCASRLGADIVAAALAHGARVVATDRDAAALAGLVAGADAGAGLGAGADHLLVLPLDPADEPRVADALRAAAERFGPIDVLVHADTLRHAAGPASTAALVRGVFNITRAALPAMRARGAGRIHPLMPGRTPAAGGAVLPHADVLIAGFCDAVSLDVAGDGVTVAAIEPYHAHAALFATSGSGRGQMLEEA